MRSLLTILGLILTQCACEAPPSDLSSAETSGFFDESGLLEGAVELDEAACVGTGPLEIRGQVATLKPQATSLLDEQAVSKVRVDLALSSVSWDFQDALMSAETDALGRFCFRLPADQELGPKALLKATTTPALRRIVLDARDVNIHLTSEAIIQLLQKSDITASNDLKARLLNLTTLAGTQVELLNPVQFAPDDTTQVAVGKLVDQLESDARIQASLEALKSGGPQ